MTCRVCQQTTTDGVGALCGECWMLVPARDRVEIYRLLGSGSPVAARLEELENRLRQTVSKKCSRSSTPTNSP